MASEYGIGTRLAHEKYGEGIVVESTLTTNKVFFRNFGDKEFAKEFDRFEVISEVQPSDNSLSLDDVERALAGVLQKFADFTMLIPIGERWRGGKLILQPGNKDLSAKEIPIDTFFHKIVMVRDRLRVLEQNINSNSKLADDEKVQLQQYITRIYGSLTTFNVLFKNKEDFFKGEGGS